MGWSCFSMEIRQGSFDCKKLVIATYEVNNRIPNDEQLMRDALWIIGL